MHITVFDGLWAYSPEEFKQIMPDGYINGTIKNPLLKLMSRLQMEGGLKFDWNYFPWDLKDTSKVPYFENDNILGYSMGGQTALRFTDRYSTVGKFNSLIGIDPVFGWFGGKDIVHEDVKAYLQLKAKWTLPWNLNAYYVRSPNHPLDHFERIDANHANIAAQDKTFEVVRDFLKSVQ